MGVSQVSGDTPPLFIEEPSLEMPELRDTSPQFREAFRRMDHVDVEVLSRRPSRSDEFHPSFSARPFPHLRTALAKAIATERVRRS